MSATPERAPELSSRLRCGCQAILPRVRELIEEATRLPGELGHRFGGEACFALPME
jgi:hypothetical protein